MEDARLHARNLVERFRRRAEQSDAVAAELRVRLAEELREVGPRLGVSRALLFGSLAWGGFSASRSDVDLLVYGVSPAAAIDLDTLLSQRLHRPVQVVRAETAPDSLRRRVESEGEPVDVA